MLLTSEDYREMTRTVREAYERLCDGCLVMVQEGGYSEAYVPFCGHTGVEELSSVRTAIEDPRLYFLRQQQASAELRHFQRGRL